MKFWQEGEREWASFLALIFLKEFVCIAKDEALIVFWLRCVRVARD